MKILPVTAIVSAAVLLFLLFDAVRSARPEMRKAFVIPGSLQIFAAAIFLARGRILPEFLPPEILSPLCYFFSLYLTFTAAKELFSGNRRFSKRILWSVSAITAWTLSLLGGTF